jgi:hypothetical protein
LCGEPGVAVPTVAVGHARAVRSPCRLPSS